MSLGSAYSRITSSIYRPLFSGPPGTARDRMRLSLFENGLIEALVEYQ